MPVSIKPTILALALLAAPGMAMAQMPGMSHGAAAGSAAGSGAAPDSMMGSMDKMSKDMAAVPMTGDADHDFAAMMIPHHQGAVEMARYELAHGKDPALRKMAQGIIAAQNKEIAAFKQWLAKHSSK